METKKYQFEKVMVVDDTQIDRYIANRVMSKSHFAMEILEFDMADKALDYLEEHQHHPEMLPQVILVDIRMPKMDGFQFLERMSALPQCVKQTCCIIMLSTSLDKADHDRANSNPVVKKFVNKPLNESKLGEITELFKNANFNEALG